METALAMIMCKLEFIHESCDEEYKKQKEEAYYQQWYKSIIMSELWYAIFKGWHEAKFNLNAEIMDKRWSILSLLREKRKEQHDLYEFADKSSRHFRYYDYVWDEISELKNKLMALNRPVSYPKRVSITVGDKTEELVNERFKKNKWVISPMLHGVSSSFFTVDQVFRRYYNLFIKK